MTARQQFILCADDFAMTAGASQAILALAAAGRLSATSAIVTTDDWPRHAKDAVAMRDRLCLGLHLNLTFGRPLGDIPSVAPDGRLSQARTLGRALARRIEVDEVSAEINRQFDRFELEAGAPPDFVDGHHHVHVLPVIRDALIGVVERRYPDVKPLVRNPADRLSALIARRVAFRKAVVVSALASRFARLLREKGLLSNEGFSGFSGFGPIAYAREFESFLIARGPRHMIMCHPGIPQDGESEHDAIAERRREEYAFLSTHRSLDELVWRPVRRNGAGTVDWLGTSV